MVQAKLLQKKMAAPIRVPVGFAAYVTHQLLLCAQGSEACVAYAEALEANQGLTPEEFLKNGNLWPNLQRRFTEPERKRFLKDLAWVYERAPRVKPGGSDDHVGIREVERAHRISGLSARESAGEAQPRGVTAKIEHDIDDGHGRSVKIVLEGLAGPSFELYSEPVPGGGLQGELHVLGLNGERNHGSKPFLVEVQPADRPLATAQAFAEQVWAVIDQEYLELINEAKHSKNLSSDIHQQVRALLVEDRLRKQQVLGDIVDAFVELPEPKWTGWKKGYVTAKLASHGLKLADEVPGVTQPALDQFYAIAAQAMQDGDVKTFNQFEAKLRAALGEQFQPFMQALGGFGGLHPIWDAVVEHDQEDLEHSLEELRISPRLPSAKDNPKKPRKVPLEDPYQAERLQPDLAAMTRDPGALAKNVGLMLQYPEFRGITGATDAEKAERIVEHMVDNLLWLYKQWRGEHRNRSKAWYVGGNRIVHRWSERFRIQPAAVAGVLAALSPQQHWFQNVTMAERVISAMVEHYDQPWDDKMTEVVLTRSWGGRSSSDAEQEEEDPEAERVDNEEIEDNDDLESTPGAAPAGQLRFTPVEIDLDATKRLKPYRMLGNFQEQGGLSLKDMDGPKAMNLYLQAIWIRAYDEAHNPNGCRAVTPEGEFGDWYHTNKGAPVKNRWNSFDELMKALRVFKDPSARNISDCAGANHKVRSFYNNLVAPLSQGGDVTIDTHAVAAALIRPLSSSSIEVTHNFGGGLAAKKYKPAVPAHLDPATGRMVPEKKAQRATLKQPGPSSSAITGATGLYGFYAEAYRRAAEQLGIQPREMQSITWECVRGLFKPAQKRDKKFVKQVENQWSRYGRGISSKDTTRNNVLALAGGGDPTRAIEPPAWSVPHPGDAEGTRDFSFSGSLPGGESSGQGSGRAAASRGGAGAAARAAAWLGSRGRRVAKLLQPKTAEQIKGDTYSMTLQEAIDEHQKLVHALQTPSHADDAEEAKEQGAELQEFLEAKAKTAGCGHYSAWIDPAGQVHDIDDNDHGSFAEEYLGLDRDEHDVVDKLERQGWKKMGVMRGIGAYFESCRAFSQQDLETFQRWLQDDPGKLQAADGWASIGWGRLNSVDIDMDSLLAMNKATEIRRFKTSARHAKLLRKKAALTPFRTLAIVPVHDGFSKAQAVTPYFQGEAARACLQELRSEHDLPVGGFDILGVKFLGFQWNYDPDYPGKTAFYQVDLQGDPATVARIEQAKQRKIQQVMDGFGAVAVKLPGSAPLPVQAKLLRPKQAVNLKPVAAPLALRNRAELARWMQGFLDTYDGFNSVEGRLKPDQGDELMFVMGPDALGDCDTVYFTEGRKDTVKTTAVDFTKLTGAAMASWADSRFSGVYPLTGSYKAVSLPSFDPLTPEQIDQGALDRMLEPYSDPTFKFWLLKTWATANYRQAGQDGSSRACFQLDNDYALKIARNPIGFAQNLTESHIAQNFHDLPVAQVHHITPGHEALLVDFAHALKAADFRRDFGLDFGAFCHQVLAIVRAAPDQARQLIQQLPTGARELMVSLQRHSLAPTDLLRPEQWGDVRHHAVLIDYGLTHQVWDDHYKAKQQVLKAQQAQPAPPQGNPPVKPDPFNRAPGPIQPRPAQPVGQTAKQASQRPTDPYDGYCPICGQAGCRGECA